MNAATSAIFTDAITLTLAPPEHADHAFLATTQDCPWPKAYGGDLIAAAATAALRTVTDGKSMHSIHSYFMRPARMLEPVRYEVEILRDGRGYSTRQVRAVQDGKLLLTCMANFAAGEPGGSYRSPMPTGIPGPEELPSTADYLAGRTGGTMTDRSKAYWSTGRSFDMRHVPEPVYLDAGSDRVPQQAVWVRPFDDLRPVPGLDEAQRDLAALAYVCDYSILEPVLRVLGLGWAQPEVATASLDHAMWFHRQGRVDGWLLYAQEAVAAEAGRGLAAGRFFTPDGTHLATVLQEGMIRVTPPAAGVSG